MTYADNYNIRTTSVKFNDVADALDGLITRNYTGLTTGTSTAYVATPSPAWDAYTTSGLVVIIPHVTNTGASTINISGLGARDLKIGNTAIAAGVLQQNVPTVMAYTGTYFEVLLQQEIDSIWLSTTSGTATAQIANANPPIGIYKAGQKFRMKVGPGLGSTGAANTAHTININSVGTKNIVEQDGANPTIGSWVAGAIMELVYDGTNFVIVNDPGGWLDYTITTSNFVGVAPNVIDSITTHNVRFRKSNKTCQLDFNVQVNLTTGGGNSLQLTPPINAPASINSANMFWANGGAVDSAATYIPFFFFTSATALNISRNALQNSNWAAGTGTYIRINFTYECV